MSRSREWLGARWFLIAAGGAGAIAAAVVAAALLLSAGSEEGTETETPAAAELRLTLTPSETGPEGIPADTTFVLKSEADLSRETVASRLRVSPAVELDVREASAREFEVAPKQPLEADAVYRFTFSGAEGSTAGSWAFQVRSPLRVVQTLPAGAETGVPLDSGIEVTFSHDGVQDASSYVDISPPVEGHWEQHKRTFVFAPRGLAPYTLYTVRVKAGVSVPGTSLALAEDYVFQFETGERRRAQTGPVLTFDFLHKVGEWGTKDAPVVTIYTNDTALTELPLEVFAYPGVDAFIADIQAREDIPYWARFSRDRKTVDTSALAPVLTFTAPIEGGQQVQNYYGAQGKLYVRFPQALATGYYLVQTHYQDTPVQAWLQVTDVATYMAVSDTTTLVWVNDVSTGKPVQGAEVRINGQARAGSTDAQGIAQFDTPKEMLSQTTDQYRQSTTTGRGFLTVTDPAGRVAVVPVSPVISATLPGGRDGSFVDRAYGVYGTYDYWDFAIADRPVYQPDDTVRFWGVALPRDGDGPVELTAELVGYSNSGGQTAYPEKVTLKTTDFGTFTGEFPLKSAEEGYHTLNISGPQGFITGLYFQVARYVKPAYKIDVIPARTSVFSGESVDVAVGATFYDGTPVPGLKLRYYSKGLPADLVTDAQGRASFQVTAEAQDASYVTPLPVTVIPAGFEEGEVIGQAMVYVFPSALQLAGQSSYREGQVTLAGHAYNVDPSLFTTGADSYGYLLSLGDRPGYVTGGAPGTTINATVTEQLLVPTEVGETYDFINKVSRKVYRYDVRQGATFNLSVVSDADGAFSLSFPSVEGRQYQVELSALDGQGRTTILRLFAAAAGNAFDTGGTAYITSDRAPDNAVFFANASLELGDKTTLRFRRGPDELPAGGPNRYLFYEGQRGIRHYEVVDRPSYDLTFADRHIPSAVIGGVWFNGFTYIEAQYGPTLVFNPRSRKLNIAVRALQDSYKPGDEASVEVNVTDAAGKPVEAEVNLAAVDEALFDVADFYSYQEDILRQLYAQVPSGIVRTYASHQYPPSLIEPGGRGGDGGGRQDFADVAFYQTVRTDSSGRAKVSFKLPDNLTSWRVTAYGVSRDLKAGRGAGHVRVSLPFSVDVSLNTDYLTGELPQMRLRAFGDALAAGDDVTFRVSTDGADPVTARANAFEDAFVPLGRLTAGDHEVTVEARTGGFEDKVTRAFKVRDSRAEVAQVRLYDDVTSGTRFDPGSGDRATVTFVDAGRGAYFGLLSGLRWAYGDRVDQALARTIAARMLQQYFGETEPVPAFEPTPYLKVFNQQPFGVYPGQRKPGVAVLPYAEPDLAVTARAAALAPDLFGREALRAALAAVADARDETAERQAIALYGLAALDEPVLNRLVALDADPEIGWRGRLYVALGLQALGDDAGASAVLSQLLDAYGEASDPWLRLRVGEDEDDSIEASALAAVVAAGVGDKRAESLLRYVRENYSSEHLLYLDELQYLAAALPRTEPAAADFTFTAGGPEQDVRLEKGRAYSISLTASEVKALRVDVREGRLATVVRFARPLAAGFGPSPDLKVTRTVRVAGQPTTSIPASGALVEVTLQLSFGPQAPDGCYQVTDILPSGLKAVTQPAYLFDLTRPAPFLKPGFLFPYLLDGQRISFCASKQQATLTYYARPSGKGEFIWEPATLQNMRAPGLTAASDPLRITVE
jgi:hypothetical protein